MEGYNATLKMESTDGYQKVKRDLIHSMIFIQKLPTKQYQMLV